MASPSNDRQTVVEFPVPLTPRASRILAQAAEQARAHGADSFIGVEHIVMAVLADPSSVPTQVLAGLGVADEYREALAEVILHY